MNANNRQPKIVMIKWRDVMSLESGLLEEKDCENIVPAHAFLVGFLVRETKDAYYIAKEYWETGQFKYLHVVPKSAAIVCIKEIS